MMKEEKSGYGWPLVGNGHIVSFLSKSIISKTIAGAYIFCGPNNLGKSTLARYFSQVLLCQARDRKSAVACNNCPSCRRFKSTGDNNAEEDKSGSLTNTHSDLHVVKKEKDKKNISIEQVREFIRKLSMSSFLNSYKIGVINEAHTLSIEAANALLKTLEEPKSDVVIILITSDADVLPSTIISRSQILNFHPVKPDIIYDYLVKEHKAPRSAAKNFSRASLGRPALAVKFLEDKAFYDDYHKIVKVFLSFGGSDINKHFNLIEELAGKKAAGRENAKTAEEIMEIWQGLVRDMLLLNYSRNDLIQHHLVEKELEKLKIKFSAKSLVELSEKLRLGLDYLKANVGAKAVLENIVINF
ncbi:AAA family ATPase [Candidatus Falkowbacteria bacterium]|nr:AAA family ATPase [Candidatus Falkowbacteria bacterium]